MSARIAARRTARVVALTALLAGCSLLPTPRPQGPPAPPPPPPLPAPLPTTRFELPEGGNVVGELQVMRTRQKDTLIDVAQAYHLGFDELVAANPTVDPWLPGEGTEVVLPTRIVLPDTPRQGLVINLASKRLFFYPKPAKGERPVVITYPVSIGREGWATPLGLTKVAKKVQDPVWRVPLSVRKEHEEEGDPLPAVVPPGPDNPLGRYAMRLALSGDYLIHGTNKPAGVGMRISHGCIRMNPDDIEALYPQVPVGLPVRLVNQAVMVGWRDGELLLTVHPGLEEDKPPRVATVRKEVARQVSRHAGKGAVVDDARVAHAITDARGLPVPVLAGSVDLDAQVRGALRVANVVSADWYGGEEPAPAAGGTAR